MRSPLISPCLSLRYTHTHSTHPPAARKRVCVYLFYTEYFPVWDSCGVKIMTSQSGTKPIVCA